MWKLYFEGPVASLFWTIRVCRNEQNPGKIDTVETVRNQMRQLYRLFIELETLGPVFDSNKNIIYFIIGILTIS